MTVGKLSLLKSRSKFTKFVQINGCIEGLRRKKSHDEIQKILRACRITKSVLRRVPGLLRLGMTENELQFAIDQECQMRGADGMAFPTIVGFGVSTSEPHHHPSSHRKLADGDVVQIDCGAMYRGYCSDYSRVLFFGDPPPEARKVFQVLTKAKKVAEKLVRPGIDVHSLDRAAREVLGAYGYEKYFIHSLGHGLGLFIHEDPRISCKAPADTLLQGDVITIEPGVYIPGKFGLRIEDTYVIV